MPLRNGWSFLSFQIEDGRAGAALTLKDIEDSSQVLLASGTINN